MIEQTATVKLHSGEEVALAVVRAPDLEWAARIEPMLEHKGPPWTWQNAELLRRESGLEARFFVLHRNQQPFANIMLVETDGVAVLGHVWTDPAERRGGASSRLMEFLLEDFALRGGAVIFLGTEFDSAPWHFYCRRGFEPIEAGSGYMVRYWQPRAEFEQRWFEPSSMRVEPLDWQHWVAAAPLATWSFPEKIRLAATGLIGRVLNEGAFLPVLREQQRRRATHEPDCAVALVNARRAVLGWAALVADPMWPGREVLDVFCSPAGWNRAEEMIEVVLKARAGPVVAYSDAEGGEKARVLQAVGFRQIASLPDWLGAPAPSPARVKVFVWELSP